MAITMWVLADQVFSRLPGQMGLAPDGDTRGVDHVTVSQTAARIAAWRDRTFLTLATGMALGLFAQIGIIAHLYSLLVAALGTTQRWAMALLTLVAVVGRTYTGWFMPVYANRPG